MKQETFNLFDAINREGIGNEIWGLCKDIEISEQEAKVIEQKNQEYMKATIYQIGQNVNL